MKPLILSLILSGLCLTLVAQDAYFRQASEVEGKHTAFTVIEINAAPEVVRTKFLAFEDWSQWNPVIPQISVKSGDINDLSSNPTLDLTLDFGRKNDPAPAPVFPDVTENNPEVFNWGFDKSIIKAEHVFIFEPINDGKGTRLVHYERMQGFLKSFVMTKKTKANMIEKYILMNEEFKKFCEASQD